MTSDERKDADAKQPGRDRGKKIRGWILAVAILVILISCCMSAVWITCPRPTAQTPKTLEGASTCLSTEETMAKEPEAACADQLTPAEKYIQTQIEAGQPAKLPSLPVDASTARDEEK